MSGCKPACKVVHDTLPTSVYRPQSWCSPLSDLPSQFYPESNPVRHPRSCRPTALSPCTQPGPIQPPSWVLCQLHCERLLISRLQKASSALTKRGRAMERALRQSPAKCVFMYFYLYGAQRYLPIKDTVGKNKQMHAHIQLILTCVN